MSETEGGIPEPSSQKDVGSLITHRLDELAQERGSETEEQIREEKATGRPLPAALVLLRRLGEVEQDVAGRDEHSRQDFAMMRYDCGLAVLGELMRQDAELTVLYNRHRGRSDTEVLLVTDAQTEAVEALDAQRQQLAQAFPTVSELPTSPRQQAVVSTLAGRVGIRRAHPTQNLPLDPKTFSWLNLRAQREAATILEAAGPATSVAQLSPNHDKVTSCLPAGDAGTPALENSSPDHVRSPDLLP